MTTFNRLTFVIVAAVALLCRQLTAANYTETNTGFDIHDLIGNAEVIPFNISNAVALNNIFGTILQSNNVSEEDVYKIYISDPANFSVTTDKNISFAGSGLNNFDTQLFLFNSSGQGVVMNDDTANGNGSSTAVQSTIPAGTLNATADPAGFYYLVISGAETIPATSSGQSIFPNQNEDGASGYQSTNVAAPKNNGVFTKYNSVADPSGNYDLVLTGAETSAVPEPSTISLLAFGATCGLAFVRRRLRARE
jgi:hypothetical protein